MDMSFAHYQQRVRGHSFSNLRAVDKHHASKSMRPKGEYMLPKASATQRAQQQQTVVFDLDETLVYSRDGPLYARPHLQQLLAFTCLFFEAVVWTAGTRDYADAVLSNVDPNGEIQHCIYRHSRWYREDGPKELRLLGRDLSRVIMFENNPCSVRGNEENCVLLSDYDRLVESDASLIVVLELLRGLKESGQPVPQYLAESNLVERRLAGDGIEAYHLRDNAFAAPAPGWEPVQRTKWLASVIIEGTKESAKYFLPSPRRAKSQAGFSSSNTQASELPKLAQRQTLSRSQRSRPRKGSRKSSGSDSSRRGQPPAKPGSAKGPFSGAGPRGKFGGETSQEKAPSVDDPCSNLSTIALPESDEVDDEETDVGPGLVPLVLLAYWQHLGKLLRAAPKLTLKWKW
eukprot:NODE_1317_length_1588_cov_22.570500_g1182_i0.p1 GENE.NODE_1317_length_1588_cov_22.570500_g1182_i0~~NODE_1317_length_1588_cov_22.570500_g1182_i0.p1  ORF type:complete len:401 (+),score=70.03 NODE_1317_length_1588_cov_22.570500_g1182_i0:109-1311(+)